MGVLSLDVYLSTKNESTETGAFPIAWKEKRFNQSFKNITGLSKKQRKISKWEEKNDLVEVFIEFQILITIVEVSNLQLGIKLSSDQTLVPMWVSELGLLDTVEWILQWKYPKIYVTKLKNNYSLAPYNNDYLHHEKYKQSDWLREEQ